ncbi:hypothetical protein LSH36_532g00030 [Paralvinella palmiformis]|uniref:Globin domain-containing protein n=1 Tax=Paralvinella palmiformis TaxID=53620 RepID=A0AAD9J7E2_9ANNE|nr:hypothetical protein LSH36_532g00030 [Paralvinella palmiformis]
MFCLEQVDARDSPFDRSSSAAMNTLIVVICTLVAVATASTECGPLQRLKVKQQWSVGFGTANHRIDIGTALWRSIFHQAPQAIDQLFKRVEGHDLYSGKFQAHSMRVLGGLNMVISVMDDDTLLHSILEHLRDQHKDRAIPRNYFKVFKAALMKVMPYSIGRCFDKEAWSSCFDVITDTLGDY